MTLLLLILLSVLLFSCDCSEPQQLGWIKSEIDENYVDVFYMTSTCVINSYLPDSTESYTAVLDTTEISYLTQEDLFIRNEIFGDSLNFFAPLYHQFTMSSLNCPEEKFDEIYSQVAKEMCDAFDYYMENMNGGRRFILAGFSQGAMYVRDLLNHMTDEQYSRMVSAYMFGYGLSEEDCHQDRIIPASDRFSRGVTVSFNTVADTSAIWSIVQNDACTCINPMNWSTDTIASDFLFDGTLLEVHVDKTKNALVVEGFDEKKYPLSFDAPWPEGCLHHFEVFFYNDAIHRNALDRAYRGL